MQDYSIEFGCINWKKKLHNWHHKRCFDNTNCSTACVLCMQVHAFQYIHHYVQWEIAPDHLYMDTYPNLIRACVFFYQIYLDRFCWTLLQCGVCSHKMGRPLVSVSKKIRTKINEQYFRWILAWFVYHKSILSYRIVEALLFLPSIVSPSCIVPTLRLYWHR